MNRRDFLKVGAFGTLGVATLAIPLGQQVLTKSASQLPAEHFPRPYAARFARPPVLRPYDSGTDEQGPYARYSLTAMAGIANMVPGLTTPVHGYNGIFPGPVISTPKGTRTMVRVRNQLPALHPQLGHPTHLSTHLHGSASLPQFDGYTNDLTSTGSYKEYLYPNFQPARTLWYHDHAVHNTAQNVYSGLAGVYYLRDEYEREQLPQGEFDVPLVVSDAIFTEDGTLGYDDRSHSGLWGDVILVNGVPWPTMKVKRRVYRFRILVASISRSYRFALSTGEPLTVVATDGGLMPIPQPVGRLRHGNAERYEVLIDFSGYSPGTRVDLVNRGNPDNRDFDHTGKVMRFEVTDEDFDTTNNWIPSTLDVDPETTATMSLRPDMAVNTTRLNLKRDDATQQWTIDGTSWADVAASGFRDAVASPGIGEVQIWEVESRSGGWFHPFHLHLVDFKVFKRNTNRGQPLPWERGPKDTVYIGQNEKVSLLVRFSLGAGNTGGRYMLHCHNLPHEDHDMMAQFRVGPNDPDSDPNDPIAAAPPVLDDLPPDLPEYEPPVARPGR
ncbi:multicopper oxidase family protein [soil metagenome]